MLSITSKLLLAEAQKNDIHFEIVSERHNLILFSFANKRALIRRSKIPLTSSVFPFIADCKEATYDLLNFFGFSCPEGKVVSSLEEAREVMNKLDTSVVVKPELGSQGKGVTAGIANAEDLEKAFQKAQKENPERIIVQKFIEGDDYRILVVGFKVVAIAKRIPARVWGDGKSTVEQLINLENQNPMRGPGHQSPMTFLSVDSEVKRMLQKQNLTLGDVPLKNLEVKLRQNANLSTGGEAENVTESVSAKNIELFEQMARALDANIVGIDLRAKNITQRLGQSDYAVIEVNASPGLRMHHFPVKGQPINAAGLILKELFPEAF